MVGRRVEATGRDRRRWRHALESGGQIEAQHDELSNSSPRLGDAVFFIAVRQKNLRQKVAAAEKQVAR